ncbi:hypothetical protein CNR22_01785 [Sphingobacteriaceae bacterium]|nr:hypothetical protein CNR22_01785 [Sphingobacteriaceae bacterium]
MNNSIAYSILKYKHVDKLGESINLGLLFIFPGTNVVEFVFPKSLLRLKKAFPDAEIEVIKSYLVSFRQKKKQIEKFIHNSLFEYDLVLEEFFFQNTSGSLQFDKFNFGILIKDPDTTIHHYSQTYLSAYESPVTEFRHKTGGQLIKKLQHNILSRNPKFETIIQEERTPLINGKVNFRVDLKWENNTTHFVKGLSLDLESEEVITNKALLIQNQLNYLKGAISARNAGIDLLIAAPQDNKFTEAYQYALEILNAADANLHLYEEVQLDTYTDKVLEEAHIS